VPAVEENEERRRAALRVRPRLRSGETFYGEDSADGVQGRSLPPSGVGLHHVLRVAARFGEQPFFQGANRVAHVHQRDDVRLGNPQRRLFCHPYFSASGEETGGSSARQLTISACIT